MMTSRSFEAIIAAVNSIHLRTQPRVMSAVAPANASGARTAASRIISLRIIMAAQMTTTEASTARDTKMTTAGLFIPDICMNVNFAPSPSMLVPSVN
jgi:hypothetical protein